MKGAASGIKAIESVKYLTYHRKLELSLISKDRSPGRPRNNTPLVS